MSNDKRIEPGVWWRCILRPHDWREVTGLEGGDFVFGRLCHACGRTEWDLTTRQSMAAWEERRNRELNSNSEDRRPDPGV